HAIPTISRESLAIADSANQREVGFKVEDGIIDHEPSELEGTLPLLQPHIEELLSIARPDYPLLGLIGTQPFIHLPEGLRSMGFYNFQPAAMRLLQKPLSGPILEKDGHNLASAVRGLQELEPETVERVGDYLTLINEDVQGFEVVTYGEYETVKFFLRGG